MARVSLLGSLNTVLRSSFIYSPQRLACCPQSTTPASDPRDNQKKPETLMDSYAMMKEVIMDMEEKEIVPDCFKFFDRCFENIVPHGKKIRGKAVVRTFSSLIPNASYDEIIRAHAVGWAVEMMHTSLLMGNDMMNNVVFQRGKQSWHTFPEVGLNAINEMIEILTGGNRLLDKFCQGHPAHKNIAVLFASQLRHATIGECLEILCHPPGTAQSNLKFHLLTMERLQIISKYKMATHVFSFPVRHGLYLAGLNDKQLHKDVQDYFLPYGFLYQVQDDFIDIFGLPEKTGRKGMDIENGRINWFIVKALEKANPAQKKVLQDHFGKTGLESKNQVKIVFQELGLPDAFEAFQVKQYNQLQDSVSSFCQQHKQLPKIIFEGFLEDLYQRRA